MNTRQRWRQHHQCHQLLSVFANRNLAVPAIRGVRKHPTVQVHRDRRQLVDAPAAGVSIDANPDMWLRLMLGGPMHEMGVEYTEAIAALLKRISSLMWDRDVSEIAVDRERLAVRDRTTPHWVTGRHIKNWYLQRAVLVGYERV